MKIGLLAVSVVLLIISLLGVYQAYSLPTERNVTEEVTVLDYQHSGRFDYLVSLKPSHLYGPEPQETPPPPPETLKYPAAIIDRFNVSFSFHFIPESPVARTSEEFEVRALVRSPGVTEQQQLILVPKTSRTGDFTITFPLDISENTTADNITISDNISGNEIIITAYVYTTCETHMGPIFESFTQSLPLRAKGPIIEVEGDLNHTSPGHIGGLNYEQQGEFDYEVYLKGDSPFGAIALKPPTVITLTTLPPKTAGPETTIMSRLIDGMNVSFSYHLESSQLIRKLDESLTIEAILENPGKWSKTFELVPLTGESGDFTVTFPLNLTEYIELFNTIQEETGGIAESHNLAIKAKVHTSADTDSGKINEDFVQSLTTDLAGDTLTWSENLTKSVPGSIKTKRVVPKGENYLGLPVSQTRILLTIVVVIFFVLCGLSFLWYFRLRPTRLTENEKEARQTLKKYKSNIIEIRELPEVKQGETVILLDSLEDLARTAESLLKPLLHKAEGRRHVYCVFDGTTRYEYH